MVETKAQGRRRRAKQIYERLKRELDAQRDRAEQAESDLRAVREALGMCRKALYEIEGGNRWPVEWEEFKPFIDAAKGTLKVAGFPIPEWEKNPPGWKRAAISQPRRAGQEEKNGRQ